MDKINLVCVSCRKVNIGDGKWLTPKNQIVGEQQGSLCPDCCHKRFPQFYSDFEKKPSIKIRIKSFFTD